MSLLKKVTVEHNGLFLCGIIGAFMLLCVGCTNKSEENAKYKISIDISSLSEEQVSIYDIFSKVELVSLDNNHPVGNIVYTGVSNMAWDGSRFYILDFVTSKINIYDFEGRTLAHVNKIGRGPGEFTMASQIYYNQMQDRIEILNPMGRIFRYYTGSLKFDSELNFMGRGLSAVHNFIGRDDRYILCSNSINDQLWYLDATRDKLGNYDYRTPEYLLHYITPQSPLFEIGGLPCFFRPFDGLIYTLDLDSNKVIPFIEWDLGEAQCKMSDIPKDLSSHVSYDFILRNSKKKVSPFIDIKAIGSIVFASVIYDGGKEYTLYHNLEKNETKFFYRTKEGMRFFPELFDEDRKCMFKFIDFTYLPEFINRDELDTASKAAYDKVLAENGSAIAIYYF